MIPFWRAFFGLTIAVALGGVAAAQEAGPMSDGIREGIYRDLTWIRTAKLSTAEYVNPDLLKTTAIYYKYEPAQLRMAVDKAKIIELLKDGHLAFAPMLEDEDAYGVSAEWDAAAWDKLRGVFVSYDADVLGVKPVGKVVTWAAGDPVRDREVQ